MPAGRIPGDEWVLRGSSTATLLIASGLNLSNYVELRRHALLMIHTPSGIAGSLMTFQAQNPAGAANVVYDDLGLEVQVVYGASRAVGVDVTGALAAARWLALRTGPTGSLNNQTDNMVIGLDMKY